MKVVLAYSGGLDTSVAIRWINEKYNLDVIALTVDVGNEKDFEVVRQKALRTGAIKGKLAYLAPEYLRNDGVDRRADVFAAGVMLWELLAGRRLWHGMSEAQIVHLLAASVPACPPLPAACPIPLRPMLGRT